MCIKSDLPDRTFRFSVMVVNFCKYLQKRSDVSPVLINQLLKSGTSVGANVEEAQSSQSEADFLSKYSIACKECRETLYWLRLIKETELVSPDLELIIGESNELVAILTAIIKKLKSREKITKSS